MIELRRFLFALLLVLLLAPLAPYARAAQMHAPPRTPARYTVAMPQPSTHLFEVTSAFDVTGPVAGFVELHLPVWAPGSYLVREFERHIQDFSATFGGQPAAWVKTAKSTWRVTVPKGARGAVEARYRVYANDLSVRTSHLDDTHGYFNGSNLFLYTADSMKSPAQLTLELPQGWDVATGLEVDQTVPPSPNSRTFRAPDYDRLVDSPVEAGIFKRLTFDAVGKPHEIILWGRGNYLDERLRTDFKKIVEAAAAIFGNTLPYDRYVYILHLYPGGGGGLEHLNSTTIESSGYVFAKKDAYRDFLGLVAHEYFHAWLVKRIRPVALGPFDYSTENYTHLLWLMEGGTDFYANVLLLRAGLITEDEYYKELSKSIESIERTPGRRHMSLEDSSFDAWVKFYRPNEHSVNSQVSYYTKGGLVTAMMDLEIKGRTGNAKSFDDVLRWLWETYTSKGLGIPEDSVEKAATLVAGSSMTDFFTRYVRGTDEIPYDTFLKVVGRKLVAETPKDDSRVDASSQAGWFGASLADSGGRTTVSSVLEGSPAWTAGINTGDEVLAIDGSRVTAASLGDRMADRAPGTKVVVTLFRRDELRTIDVVLGPRPPEKYHIDKIEKPDDKKTDETKPEEKKPA